jgi:hypothetical protein
MDCETVIIINYVGKFSLFYKQKYSLNKND